MLEPKFERTEAAQCAGCILLMLYGGLYDVSMVSSPCGTTSTGLLI